MIAVVKNFDRIPNSLRTPECRANLVAVLNNANPGHKDNIVPRFYASPEIVRKLKAIYNSKCAYCESFEPEPQIEHYRPKKRVQGLPGHPGYYWLCYEWSNLLPACYDCNKNGVKGNYFPVEGVRINLPPMGGVNLNLQQCRLISDNLTVQEIPLLLNPEVPGFDPTVFFKFSDDGQIIERPDSETIEYRKANQTISIVKLNRDKLYLNVRKKQIRYYMGRLKGYLYLLLSGRKSTLDFENSFFEILAEIRGKTSKTHEYSFFWNYFYIHFNAYLTAYIRPKYRPKLFALTHRFKAAFDVI